jgi:hypothetical protein
MATSRRRTHKMRILTGCSAIGGTTSDLMTRAHTQGRITIVLGIQTNLSRDVGAPLGTVFYVRKVVVSRSDPPLRDNPGGTTCAESPMLAFCHLHHRSPQVSISRLRSFVYQSVTPRPTTSRRRRGGRGRSARQVRRGGRLRQAGASWQSRFDPRSIREALGTCPTPPSGQRRRWSRCRTLRPDSAIPSLSAQHDGFAGAVATIMLLIQRPAPTSAVKLPATSTRRSRQAPVPSTAVRGQSSIRGGGVE